MRTAFIVRNLIQLTQGASCGDLTSLEAMMALLVTRGHIPPAVVRMLWDTFTLKVPGSTTEDSRAAVLILSMAASADQGIVKSNVDILVSHGLDASREGAGVCVCVVCQTSFQIGQCKYMSVSCSCTFRSSSGQVNLCSLTEASKPSDTERRDSQETLQTSPLAPDVPTDTHHPHQRADKRRDLTLESTCRTGHRNHLYLVRPPG